MFYSWLIIIKYVKEVRSLSASFNEGGVACLSDSHSEGGVVSVSVSLNKGGMAIFCAKDMVSFVF